MGFNFYSDPEFGVEFLFMLGPHWQTFLINVIKRLFSRKTIKFGYIYIYIKYQLESGGVNHFLHTQGGGGILTVGL